MAPKNFGMLENPRDTLPPPPPQRVPSAATTAVTATPGGDNAEVRDSSAGLGSQGGAGLVPMSSKTPRDPCRGQRDTPGAGSGDRDVTEWGPGQLGVSPPWACATVLAVPRVGTPGWGRGLKHQCPPPRVPMATAVSPGGWHRGPGLCGGIQDPPNLPSRVSPQPPGCHQGLGTPDLVSHRRSLSDPRGVPTRG